MTIQYLHASKFGNGAMVAAEFKRRMAAHGVTVEVHHIRDASPTAPGPADLYLFSSPGRMGTPMYLSRSDTSSVLPAAACSAMVFSSVLIVLLQR